MRRWRPRWPSGKRRPSTMVSHLMRAETAPDDGFRASKCHIGAPRRNLVGQFGSRSRKRDPKNQAGDRGHRQRPQPGAADGCGRAAFYRPATTPAHHCLYPFRRAKLGCRLRSGACGRPAAPDEEPRTAFQRWICVPSRTACVVSWNSERQVGRAYCDQPISAPAAAPGYRSSLEGRRRICVTPWDVPP